MSKNDGYKEWRESEFKELADIVQKKIYQLQNPADCKTAKKLTCNLNKVSVHRFLIIKIPFSFC